MNITEQATAVSSVDAAIFKQADIVESGSAHGVYSFVCMGPIESRRGEYVSLLDMLATAQEADDLVHVRQILKDLEAIPLEEKWRDDVVCNAVVPEGANYLLDKGFAGSGYTATWYLGIFNSGYTVLGTETYAAKGATENTNYSQSTRPAAVWSSASARVKALSSPAQFSINGAGGTIAGAFLCTNSTKGDSTASAGVNALWSIGAFSTGNKVVSNGDTLNVNYQTGV